MNTDGEGQSEEFRDSVDEVTAWVIRKISFMLDNGAKSGKEAESVADEGVEG